MYFSAQKEDLPMKQGHIDTILFPSENVSNIKYHSVTIVDIGKGE